MKIIKQRERIIQITYSHNFNWKDTPSAGFSFDCDENGTILNLNECSQENYKKCISGEYGVVDEGIVKYKSSYISLAIGLCPCGCEVILSNFTNTCDNCDSDYNISGDLLAPRSQWGEETGEPWWECY